MPKVTSGLKLRKLLLKHGTGKSKIEQFVDPIFQLDRVTGKALDCDAVLVVRALEDALRERVTLATVAKAKELYETGKWEPVAVKVNKTDPFYDGEDEDEVDEDEVEEKPKKRGKKKEVKDDADEETPVVE